MFYCDKISKDELFAKFSVNRAYSEDILRHLIPESDYDIKFDWENWEYEPRPLDLVCNHLIGPQELEGRNFIGFYAGGDWEYPIYFIVFSQAGVWRAYIPKNGNVYNHDTQQAFGNGEDYLSRRNLDFEFLKREYPDEMKDIGLDDYDSEGHNCEVMLDWGKIRQDILANILI